MFGIPGRAVCLIVGLLLPGAALGQGATVNVIHDRTEGVVRVNDVPVHRFRSRPPFDGPATNAFNIGLWAVNGDNTVKVESRPTPGQSGGSTRVNVLDDLNAPPLFEKTLEGEAAAAHALKLDGLPVWIWTKAEPWTGTEADLLAAVTALHAAFAKADADKILALSRAAIADLTVIMGPMPPEARADMENSIKTGKLAPLPPKLTVASYHGGRLFVVARADGSAPIQVTLPDMPDDPLEHGQYWTRLDGAWSVVRW